MVDYMLSERTFNPRHESQARGRFASPGDLADPGVACVLFMSVSRVVHGGVTIATSASHTLRGRRHHHARPRPQATQVLSVTSARGPGQAQCPAGLHAPDVGAVAGVQMQTDSRAGQRCLAAQQYMAGFAVAATKRTIWDQWGQPWTTRCDLVGSR